MPKHKRFTLARNGTPEAVLLSADDLEGLEPTLEMLADADRSLPSPSRWPSATAAPPTIDIATVRQQVRQPPAATG